MALPRHGAHETGCQHTKGGSDFETNQQDRGMFSLHKVSFHAAAWLTFDMISPHEVLSMANGAMTLFQIRIRKSLTLHHRHPIAVAGGIEYGLLARGPEDDPN